jgi:hypothetical protein
VTRTVSIADAMATVSFVDATNTDKDVLLRQYVSYPLVTGQTITGGQALKAQCRIAERLAGNNLFLTLGIRVIASDGSTVRKTVLAVTRDNTESATSLTNRAFTANSAATNYTTQAGDYLVIEIGAAGDPANTGGADHDFDLRLGDAAASDLAEDDASTSDNRPWVQLNDTLQFIYTATAAITRTATTASGSATFTAPVYTATAAVVRGATTASGAAEFTFQPVYTASAAVTRTATTASASGWTSSPHAVGKITQPNCGWFSRRYGSFSGKTVTPPYSEATASATIGAVTASASGWTSSPHLVGKITQPKIGLWSRRYGDFGSKGSLQFTATAAVIRGATAATGSATFVPPTSTAIAAITRTATTASGSANHVTPTYTATAAVTRTATTTSASGTVTPPTYTGTAAVTIGATTGTGVAIFATEVYQGEASVSIGSPTAEGSATFAAPAYTATAAITRAATTASGSAVFAPLFTASAAVTRTATIANGTARTVFGQGGLLMLRRRMAL